MKTRVASMAVMVGLMSVFAAPVSAGGASVDRITDIETVLAVRMEAEFPIASLMRADCDFTQFVTRPDGTGVETLHCHLNDNPVMIPAFQGQAPKSAFTFSTGPCLWTSDYWFYRDGSLVLASSLHYSVSPSGEIHATAYYPAEPLVCE